MAILKCNLCGKDISLDRIILKCGCCGYTICRICYSQKLSKKRKCPKCAIGVLRKLRKISNKPNSIKEEITMNNQSDNQNKFLDEIKTLFEESALSEEKVATIMHLYKQFIDQVIEKEVADKNELETKLRILYEYEKHYLELIKEYKEEIKFANSVQENIRGEKTQFFTQTLRQVFETLKDAQVDKNVISERVEELVKSYTKSLDTSADLVETHAVDIISMLREETKKTVNDVKDSESNEKKSNE